LPVTAAMSSSPEAYREPLAWMCSFNHSCRTATQHAAIQSKIYSLTSEAMSGKEEVRW
jgi:hypothetical protein